MKKALLAVLVPLLLGISRCPEATYTLDDFTVGYWRPGGEWCHKLGFAGDGNADTDCRIGLLWILPGIEPEERILAARVTVQLAGRFREPNRPAYFSSARRECADVHLIDYSQGVLFRASWLGPSYGNSPEGYVDAGDGVKLGRVCFLATDAIGTTRSLWIRRPEVLETLRASVFGVGMVLSTADGSYEYPADEPDPPNPCNGNEGFWINAPTLREYQNTLEIWTSEVFTRGDDA